MKTHNITLFFISILNIALLHGADFPVQKVLPNTKLISGMWGTQDVIDDFSDLTESTCFNPYWQNISASTDQQEKDRTLRIACSACYTDYRQQRRDIAAALLAKANINSVHDVRLYKVPLYIALRHDDIPLTTMALEHGASIHPRDYCPAINYARSIPAAELLIKHNALQSIQLPAQSFGAGLMQIVMRLEYDPELILLYHQHNISSTQEDRFKMTPLRALIDTAHAYHKHIPRLETKLQNLLSCFKKSEIREQTDPATMAMQFLALMTRTPLRKATYTVPYTILSDTLTQHREKALIE